MHDNIYFTLKLTNKGMEQIQVHTDRETQREAIKLSAEFSDVFDNFDRAFLQRVEELTQRQEVAVA